MPDLRTQLAETYLDIEVWAAGGVVWRQQDRSWEVLIVHRPHHDDWSFPKGKLDKGETLAEAAVREVEEETGLRCDCHTQLPVVRYLDAFGRKKLVVYWTMSAVGGEFAPNDEVDAIEWLTVDAALSAMTYERDAELLAAVDMAHLRSTMRA